MTMTNHIAFLLSEGAPSNVILKAIHNYELKYNAMLNDTNTNIKENIEEEEEYIEYVELQCE